MDVVALRYKRHCAGDHGVTISPLSTIKVRVVNDLRVHCHFPPMTFAFRVVSGASVHQRLEVSKAMMLERMAKGGKEYTFSRPGFATQVSTLLWRDAVVALRDPTLYYLQVSL